MKAIIFKKYGSPDKLQLAEVAKPVPAIGQVLLRVKAASLNAYDWRHLRADPFPIRLAGAGLFRPSQRIQVLGADMAGTVEAVGPGVTGFKAGDEIFGEGSYGGLAEYACVKEDRFALKPSFLSFEEAAAIPMAGLTALQGLRDIGKIREGARVLINGASGGVGSFAVQIATAFGAKVTAVCSTPKVDFTRTLGASEVIDYRKEDITQSQSKFDLILDTAAFRSPEKYREIMNPGAMYVLAGGSVWRIAQVFLLLRRYRANMQVMVARINRTDLETLSELAGSGKLKPRIDKVFPLEQTPEAFRYLESGKLCGKIVVTV